MDTSINEISQSEGHGIDRCNPDERSDARNAHGASHCGLLKKTIEHSDVPMAQNLFEIPIVAKAGDVFIPNKMGGIVEKRGP